MEIPLPVWLWILSIALIVVHATVPGLPLAVSFFGFSLAVVGIVFALWDEDRYQDLG